MLPRQVVPCDKIVDPCNTSSLEHWRVHENVSAVSIPTRNRERAAEELTAFLQQENAATDDNTETTVRSSSLFYFTEG